MAQPITPPPCSDPPGIRMMPTLTTPPPVPAAPSAPPTPPADLTADAKLDYLAQMAMFQFEIAAATSGVAALLAQGQQALAENYGPPT